MTLPLRPPVMPMEAEVAKELPEGAQWQYEPKWDGFRCLAFRDGDDVNLQSKAAKPLSRYFPELVAALAALRPRQFVLDGEIVVPIEGRLSFDDLLQRIHPAESRIRKLSRERPALLIAFDVLVDEHGRLVADEPLSRRRAKLEAFARRVLPKSGSVRLSPATLDVDQAREWIHDAGWNLDGVIAKNRKLPYQHERTAGMLKIKRHRSADCVVGGFRYATSGRLVGSLLLGLYDDEGKLNHVGFTSGIKVVSGQRRLSSSSSESRRVYGQRRRSEPMGDGTLDRMGTTRSAAGRRGSIRSFHRRALPARHALAALASRQGPAAVQAVASGAREPGAAAHYVTFRARRGCGASESAFCTS